MMEAQRTSETTVLRKSTRHNIPEDAILHAMGYLTNSRDSLQQRSVVAHFRTAYEQTKNQTNSMALSLRANYTD
jgi:hypothetical protein